MECQRARADDIRMRLTLIFACLGTLIVASPAAASTIIDRNATGATLQVNAQGEALVGYRAGGKTSHVLAWGAVNAIAPTRTRAQTNFKLDYSGGYKTHYVTNPAVKDALESLHGLQAQMAKATAAKNNKLRYALAPKIAAAYQTIHKLRAAATAFTNKCRPYDGPALAWVVATCKAPDGSYWALQSWQRMLPNLGETPWLAGQSVWELHLAHWTGELPVLDIHLDWVNTQKAHHLFGHLTYLGLPVFGYGSSSLGNPTDTFGRNIYLDVFNAPNYGPGWKRENSFLAHNPGGNFCYGFYSHAPYPGYPPGTRPAGFGERYRATVIGPGVLPDISWQGDDPGEYDVADPEAVAYEQQMNALNAQWATGDKLCHQN
jgi:hypothetical protein